MIYFLPKLFDVFLLSLLYFEHTMENIYNKGCNVSGWASWFYFYAFCSKYAQQAWACILL